KGWGLVVVTFASALAAAVAAISLIPDEFDSGFELMYAVGRDPSDKGESAQADAAENPTHRPEHMWWGIVALIAFGVAAIAAMELLVDEPGSTPPIRKFTRLPAMQSEERLRAVERATDVTLLVLAPVMVPLLIAPLARLTQHIRRVSGTAGP